MVAANVSQAEVRQVTVTPVLHPEIDPHKVRLAGVHPRGVGRSFVPLGTLGAGALPLEIKGLEAIGAGHGIEVLVAAVRVGGECARV